MTLKEIRASRPKIDHARIAATTEEDIRRHQIEDGEDPDATLPAFALRALAG
jgi:putative transcriptional regulator